MISARPGSGSQMFVLLIALGRPIACRPSQIALGDQREAEPIPERSKCGRFFGRSRIDRARPALTSRPTPVAQSTSLLRRVAGFGRSGRHAGALAILTGLVVPLHLGLLTVGLIGRRRSLLCDGRWR